VLWAAASNSYNTQILVGDTESTESVVRRFKKVCLEANIVNECRRRRYFETKQDIVKRKQKDNARKRKRFQYAPPALPSPSLLPFPVPSYLALLHWARGYSSHRLPGCSGSHTPLQAESSEFA